MFKRICKITFITHGATVYSLDGIINDTLKYPKLNEFGEEEIEKVCEYLEKRGVSYDKIYTSPNACCTQSAQIIAKLSRASSWREQLPLRMHRGQLALCWDRIRRRLMRRVRLTRSVAVWITIPSRTLVVQAGTSRSRPSTSTMQIRQAAISLISFR